MVVVVHGLPSMMWSAYSSGVEKRPR
jgi:hypothetical protein